MNRATAYLRQGKILFQSSSRTTEGVWFADGECKCLDEDALDADKGRAVLAALRHSRDSLPHPQSWDGVLTPLLNAAGAMSWSTLVRGAKLVELEQEAGLVRLCPMRNLGAKGGFVAISEKCVTFRRPWSDAELGKALQMAFTLAE